MKLIIDGISYPDPYLQKAALNAYLLENPGNYEVATISTDAGRYTALRPLSDETVAVATTPDRTQHWLPFEDPQMRLPRTAGYRWFLQEAGMEKAAALQVAKRWTGDPEAWDRYLTRSKWKDQIIRADDLINTYADDPKYVRLGDLEEDNQYLVRDPNDLWNTYAEAGYPVPIALDFETTGIYPFMEPIGYSVAWYGSQGYYVPLRDTVDCPNVNHALGVQVLSRLLRSTWVAHNAQFEMHCLDNLGITEYEDPDDTMVMAWHLSLPRGLKDLVKAQYGHTMTTFKGLTAKAPIQDLPASVVAPYAAHDASWTMRLYTDLRNLVPEVYKTDRKSLVALKDMERRGVRIDFEYLQAWEEDLTFKSEALAASIRGVAEHYGIAGDAFNPNSTQDVQQLLFGQLALTPQKFSAAGYSVDSETLDILRDEHPVVPLILKYRESKKLIGTYAKGLALAAQSQPDRRLHPQFIRTGTITGRMSSARPNGQNIPNYARGAIIADPGHLLGAADYGQIELRILAHVSGDPGLVSDFREGRSPHMRTLAAVFGYTDKSTNPRAYTLSKNINFGTVYGAGPARLVAQAREIGVTLAESEAREMLNTHKRTYPRVWEWIEDTKAQARRDGYTETIQGHRTLYPDLYSKDPQVRAAAEREAVNKIIQGTAGYITTAAMVDWRMRGYQMIAPILLQVHDEVVIQTPEVNASTNLDLLIRTMLQAADLSVPVEVEGKIGRTWKELK